MAPCAAAGARPSAGAFGHDYQARPALLVRRQPKLGNRAQSGLLDQVQQ